MFKRSGYLRVLGALAAGVMLLAGTAAADTRSATVRLSVRVLPMAELSFPRAEMGWLAGGAAPRVLSNLGSRFQITESRRLAGNQALKLYSVTAL